MSDKPKLVTNQTKKPKVYKADYKGASLEQVTNAVLLHRPKGEGLVRPVRKESESE